MPNPDHQIILLLSCAQRGRAMWGQMPQEVMTTYCNAIRSRKSEDISNALAAIGDWCATCQAAAEKGVTP